jgi:hypothetical protein
MPAKLTAIEKERRALLRRVEETPLVHGATGELLYARGWNSEAATIWPRRLPIAGRQEPLGYTAWDVIARALDTGTLDAADIHPTHVEATHPSLFRP